MHKSNPIFTAALAVIVVLGWHVTAQYPVQVKIITYNINAETHTDGDYTDIGDVIKELNPTIAGLQKVDSFSVAAKPVDVLKDLGEQTSMFPTFSKSYQKNNGSYGNGFLSDSVPINSRRLAIPKGSASEDRSALEIGVTMGGERVRVIVTHLDYASSANRTTQLEQIVAWLDEGGAATVPAVIMADFNENYNGNSMTVLTDAGFVFVKGKNGVVLDSTQKINHILYRPESRWKIIDAGNPTYAASNRNPLWADMELLDPVVAAAPAHAAKRPGSSRPYFSRHAIHYTLDFPATVSLRLYNSAGVPVKALVEDRHREAGAHSIALGKNSLSRGIYHCILSIDGHNITGKAVLVR